MPAAHVHTVLQQRRGVSVHRVLVGLVPRECRHCEPTYYRCHNFENWHLIAIEKLLSPLALIASAPSCTQNIIGSSGLGQGCITIIRLHTNEISHYNTGKPALTACADLLCAQLHPEHHRLVRLGPGEGRRAAAPVASASSVLQRALVEGVAGKL